MADTTSFRGPRKQAPPLFASDQTSARPPLTLAWTVRIFWPEFFNRARHFKRGKGVPVIHLLVPIVAHRRLIESCEWKSLEHKILSNGVIETDSAGQRRVRLLCDDGRCEKILTFVRRTHPQLESSIDKVVVSNRTGPY
jgi:hypothetical protein